MRQDARRRESGGRNGEQNVRLVEFEQVKRTRTRTEITFEQRQRISVRTVRQRVVWCGQCGAEVQMLAPAEAAAVVQTTARSIFRRVEAGEFHYLETASGELLVCRNSLEKRTKQ